MNIIELGAIGELVGGVAVVGSLIYVGLQVRQSNRLEKAESERVLRHDYIGAINQIEPVLFRKGIVGFDGLSDDDKQRFHQPMVSFFAVAQTEFSLVQRDLAEQTTFERNAMVVDAMIRTPGIGSWWEYARPTFEPPFREYMAHLTEQNQQAPAFHEMFPWLSRPATTEGGA